MRAAGCISCISLAVCGGHALCGRAFAAAPAATAAATPAPPAAPLALAPDSLVLADASSAAIRAGRPSVSTTPSSPPPRVHGPASSPLPCISDALLSLPVSPQRRLFFLGSPPSADGARLAFESSPDCACRIRTLSEKINWRFPNFFAFARGTKPCGASIRRETCRRMIVAIAPAHRLAASASRGRAVSALRCICC